MYLLDTNHCSLLIDGDAVVAARLAAVSNTLTATCVVVQGELLYMAHHSARQQANMTRVVAFLNGIRIYPIDSAVAEASGDLKQRIMHLYGPKEKAKRRHTTIAQLGFDDNDL